VLLQQVSDTALLGPGEERSGRELWVIVGACGLWVAAGARSLIEYARDVFTADAMVDSDVDSLVGEVVSDGHPPSWPTT